MADAIVNYVLGKISEVAYSQALLLYGAGDAVDWAKRELEWISAFLKDAEAKQNKNPLVKQWVKDVKEVAFMIEDALDTFLVEVGGGSKKGLFERAPNMPKELRARRKVGTEINRIKKRMTEIKESREAYGITTIESSNAGLAARQPVRPFVIPEIERTAVVGFEDDINKICHLLRDPSNSRRSVISIVAAGGRGKTTIATKVYKSNTVEHHFGARIWLTISQVWSINDVVLKMLEKLTVVDAEMRQKDTYHLITELHNTLKERRYLIVLDDVWTIDILTQLQLAFPEDNNGSRVLITTRFLNVAEKADARSVPFQLRLLDSDESKELLLKIIFPNRFVDKCPDNLLSLAYQFSDKCKGWPLALVVLGGILSTKYPDYSTWNEMMLKMNWNVEGTECIDVVSTSYDDLPVHLKPCFMYFACFPEDYEIRVSRLIRMWIAEGFIQQEITKSLEDTAMTYLEELVQRCMVQVSKKSWLKKMKNCRIHDIIHALAIRKAEEDNFLMVFPESRADSTSTSGVCTSARRAAFHGLAERGGVVRDLGQIGRNLRSLMLFGKFQDFPDFSGMVRLRVLLNLRLELPLERYCDDDWAWIQPKKMTVLRYLEFRDFRDLYETALIHPKTHLPTTHNFLSQLAHLKYIQSFEICLVPYAILIKDRGCACLTYAGTAYRSKEIKMKLSDSFWENKMLRHVIFPTKGEFGLRGWMGPPPWAKLENLVTLKGVIVRGEWSVKFPHFPNIRKLSIFLTEDENVDWEAIVNSLVQLEHLTSLHVYEHLPGFQQEKHYIDFTPAFRNFKQLRSLSLPIHLRYISSLFREWHHKDIAEQVIDRSGMFPLNLVKLHLGDILERSYKYTELKQSQEKLPNLLVLLGNRWRK